MSDAMRFGLLRNIPVHGSLAKDIQQDDYLNTRGRWYYHEVKPETTDSVHITALNYLASLETDHLKRDRKGFRMVGVQKGPKSDQLFAFYQGASHEEERAVLGLLAQRLPFPVIQKIVSTSSNHQPVSPSMELNSEDDTARLKEEIWINPKNPFIFATFYSPTMMMNLAGKSPRGVRSITMSESPVDYLAEIASELLTSKTSPSSTDGER